MSYSIKYEPELRKKYPSASRQGIKAKKAAILLLVIGVVIFCAFQTNVVKFLLPGDQAVTAAAFSSLINHMEAGVSVKESLITFCKEIIVNAS